MLDGLLDNFRTLIALYEGERDANARLSADLQASRSECEGLKQKISDLKKQIENQKLTDAFRGGSQDIAEAREKVGKLIREIDRCIAALES